MSCIINIDRTELVPRGLETALSPLSETADAGAPGGASWT